MSYPWLTLGEAKALMAEAKRRGVSKVARGEVPSKQTREGFMQAYARVRGSKRAMAQRMATNRTTWAQRREGFIARHKAPGGPWWETVHGVERPTRRHLGLVMWAYSPTPAKLKRYARQAKKNPAPRDADEAVDYFIEMGEPHPSAPTNPDIEDAIEYFDGSPEAEDDLWAQYRVAYQALKR
jgi:hypothetical protein